jgi:glucokinase
MYTSVVSDASQPGETTGRLFGIDLGGTNIKVAVVEADGESFQTVSAREYPTEAGLGPEHVARNLMKAARADLGRSNEIRSIGLGVPGLFDEATGAIALFPNLPGDWEGFPLRATIEEGLGAEITMINDARAFTLAEGTMGAGAGFRIVACVTLGTGIGGGIMIDGRLHLGAFGVAGEIGHQIIDPDGPRCGCGNQGCVEALARADVLTDLAGRETAEEVYRTAARGDRRSLAAVEHVARAVGIGLANVVTLIGPDRIVIGGGIVEAGDSVLDPIRRAIRERVTLAPVDEIDVVPADLGRWAGAHGAALAAGLRP